MTMGSIESSPVQPVPTAPAKNSFERIVGVLFSPAETFADIARKPDFLIPLLLIVAIGYATTFLTLPHLDWDAATAQQAEAIKKSRPNMTDSEVEQAQKMTKAFISVTMYVAPLLAVLWYLIVALILFGAFRLMAGSGTFKQAFSATLYAWIPLVLFGIVLTIVVVAQGTADPTTMGATAVKSNPAFLVDMKDQPVLFTLLSAIDAFTIWTIALLITGFAALSKQSWAKSAAIVVSLWVVLILVRVGFAALGAMQQSS